ncbi:hypothetical protein PTTG_02336 [Puccinia triticina 1-1 BBBD Race 1]|uniref:CCHC-type domain-containing protein n=1 Tax=Puccinia triticina (isolate 1-1 / race 1 (BBBD)) TaxID=630390 RepID=A0A180G8N6_PUCT1|nr:hypothetical protein PTTG_02336 [Puccinia triticina 1-1 BBBD Race 1]
MVEPEAVAPPKKKHLEVEAGKVLRGWPDKELPKFGAMVNENPTQWLGMMAMVLKDCQAHPAIWHSCAGQRLTGRAWQDFYNPAFSARPDDWTSFKAWLIKLSPIGITNLTVARELEKLKQEPNETAQVFHERFRVWQTKAKSINFGYDEISSFVRGLTPGLSAKVQEIMAAAAIDGKPMEMDRVLLTAVGHDHLYQQAKAVSSMASGSSKRRAEGEAGRAGKKKVATCHNCKQAGHIAAKCPEPKTDAQKAWEAANPEKTKKKNV